MADNNSSGCKCSGLGDFPLPEVDFRTFILSLSSSALVHLGMEPDPATNQISVQPHLAKHTIDILAMLQNKIKNGLQADEEKLLCDLLCQLRLKYVNVTKK